MKHLFLIAAFAACSSSHKEAPAPAPTPTPSSVRPERSAEGAESKGAPVDASAVAVATPDNTAPAAPTPPAKPEGADFTAEAKLLYRVAACGNDDPLPATIDAKVVDRHCKWVREREEKFRKQYFEGGREFFDKIVPPDAPKVVVYPFGGGDLISALVAFPDATEITTISLELAGDPRRIDTIDKHHLEDSLGALRVQIGGMLSVGSNTSENLSASQKNDLPGQVSSFLMGLAAGGYEPVGMRFFTIQPDGTLHYLEQNEIDTIETDAKARAKKRKGDWESPNFSEAFANVEIRYHKIGEDQIRVHRHIGWNLGDKYLADHGELITHLAAKGKVTMLVKGASYLLWRGDFSTIRDYMLANLAWMLSDSTGIPPYYAKKGHMVQETYGRYDGAFLEGTEEHNTKHSDDFRALWRSQPYRKLPFRFGYVDMNKQAHLVVTKPAP
ncbi:MAG TPA: hypothetical protein VL463_26000 [Kofleriaceae bacterium]|jgi:hypothetical protein|nr:hypothetical protein [Kofleriaceae bacterium]